MITPISCLGVAEWLGVHLEELRAQFVCAVSIRRCFSYLLLDVAERFFFVSLTVELLRMSFVRVEEVLGDVVDRVEAVVAMQLRVYELSQSWIELLLRQGA